MAGAVIGEDWHNRARPIVSGRSASSYYGPRPKQVDIE